uniref:TPM domain-containing protein n=1 Tax=Plectus sambesii TaxID=2011161 RepID=A0A914VIQ0_9BILA
MNWTAGMFFCCSVLVITVSAAPVEISQSNQAVTGWKTTDYPDPRTDFAKCGQSIPGLLCDPDGLLTSQERTALSLQAADIGQNSKKIINISPMCQNGTPDGLLFFFVLMNKIDANGEAVQRADAKRFSYEIKAKYGLINDANACDTTILIMCSVKDGQLYMVAGRDTLLTGDILDKAFDQTRFRFTAGNVFGGLNDLLPLLAASYGIAHSGQLLMTNNQNTESSSRFDTESTSTSANSSANAANGRLNPVPSDPFSGSSTVSSGADGTALTSDNGGVTSVPENGSFMLTSQIAPSMNKRLTEGQSEPLAGENEWKQLNETTDYFDALSAMNRKESRLEPSAALNGNSDNLPAREERSARFYEEGRAAKRTAADPRRVRLFESDSRVVVDRHRAAGQSIASHRCCTAIRLRDQLFWLPAATAEDPSSL